MATLAQVEAAFLKADKAGDTAAATVLAAEVRRLRSAGPKEAPPIAGGVNPTGGFIENAVAATGKGLSSTARALGIDSAMRSAGVPIGTKEDADRFDAPLMKTAGGQIGNAIGVAAPALAAVPFTAPTFVGAATVGGLTGAALTEGGLGDRAQGGALGLFGGLLGQSVPHLYRAGKGAVRGLAEPFLAGGRDRIAGRTLERFSTNPNALAQLTDAPTVTGARLTTAEAARDPGLATLERAIGTMDPQAAAATASRQQANNAARLESLRVLAGGATQPASRVGALDRIINSQPTRASAEATRSAAAKASYGAARVGGVDEPMAEALTPQIEQLMTRPSVQSAIAEAKALAKEEGIELTDMGSVQGLQYVKQAIDDAIGKLSPKEANKARLLTQTSSDLKSVLDEIAPALRQADAEFAMNSVPVNRAAVGERLLERTTGAIRDFSGHQRLQANRFAGALNDEDALLRNATGFNGYSSLDDILTPAQSQRVGAVRNELETVANLSNAVSGGQSQTAKMLASQNLLRQIAGPLGLPESFTSNVLSNTLTRPVQWAMQAAEPRIQDAIARGLLSPEEGARLVAMARAADAQRAPNALLQLMGRSAPAAIGGLSAYGSGQ
jgi:hypothetical protein